MWKVGNSHWCWVDVPEMFLPIPSSVLIPHGTKLNSVEMVLKQQSGLNINGTPLRINWANFKFINCNRNVSSSNQTGNCIERQEKSHISETAAVARQSETTDQRAHTETLRACQPRRTSTSAAQGCFCSGTEGVVFKALQRNTGKFVAIKKARVSPKQEGVPYYMLRELSFLKNLSHPNISQLNRVHLRNDQLYCFFDFVGCTLHDLINSKGRKSNGQALSEEVAKIFTLQLFDGIRYCHSRGVLHRNLKPKHLLVQFRDPGDLLTATIKIADFALVRSTNIPVRAYTDEVVTLWYRAPEVLMGDKYFLPIDIWSIGCIFGEMLLGKPLFPGISEIDQLFQIFSTLGTPTPKEWETFQSLPNYSCVFPNWKQQPMSRVFPKLSWRGRHLILKTLAMDPRKRINARDALIHPYFSNLDASNCVIPSFPPKCGFKALGLDTKPMDVMHKNKVAGYTFHYLGEFHAHLRIIENKSFADANWLPSHNSTFLLRRSILVDWLVEVVDVFNMSIRSVYLAVQFVDQYMKKKPVKRSSLQLVGATCLHIASKCEDVAYIGAEDLTVCADNVYSSVDVLLKEEEILNDLDFNLSSATVLDFVVLYLEYRPHKANEEVSWLSKYLSELTLQEYDLSVFARPSKVAAACISWALRCLGLPNWDPWLSAVSGYHWRSIESLYDKVRAMHRMVNEKQNRLLVIKQRYSKEERMNVASVTVNPHSNEEDLVSQDRA